MLRKVGDVGLEGPETLAQPVIPVDKLGNVITGGGGGSGSAGGGAASYLSPGSFTAVYASATSLTLSELPFPPLQGQIVQVAEYDGDNLIEVYSQDDPAYDFTWAPAADASIGTLTVDTAAFTNGNEFVVQIAGPPMDTLDVLTDFGGPYTHQGPRDFDIVRSAATTLVLGGVTAMAMDPVEADFKAVVELATGGKVRMTYTRKEWAFTWASGGSGTGTLTIAGATMQATSTFIVFVDGPEHGIQRADAGGGVAQTVKRTQHQDETGGILKSLSSLAQAGFVRFCNGTAEALLSAANTARAATNIVLSVQQLDATGKVPPAGETAGNAPYTNLTDGSNKAAIDPADTARTTATVVQATQHVDAAGKVQPAGADASSAITMIQLSALLGMTGDGIYRSGVHFTATQNAATEIDLAGGFPAIVDVGQFIGVAQISSAGAVTIFYPHQNVFSWASGNDRLTVTGATFAGTDVFVVVISGPDRYANDPGNFKLMAEVSPYPLQADSSGVPQITALQAFTNDWADCGPKIAMFGKSGITFYLTLDVNDDSNLRFRVLGKHESGGIEEYPLAIKSVSAGVVAVEGLYVEFTDDTDQLIAVRVETNGEIPYLQPQIVRGTDGGGVDAEMDALYYVRGTFGGAA